MTQIDKLTLTPERTFYLFKDHFEQKFFYLKINIFTQRVGDFKCYY